MGRRLLITGTGERVGKTTVGCALGFAMRARGMRVGVMKPIDTPESPDAQSLSLAVGSTLPMDLVCPCRTPADADPAHIARCFHEIAAQSDVVLVEAVTAVDFADLAAMLDLEVILVVGNLPGCVDAMTHILQRCDSRRINVAGCILCDCDPAPHIETLATAPSVPFLGRMRHREPLSKAIVEKLI
jgi:dethiobiotin synthetase